MNRRYVAGCAGVLALAVAGALAGCGTPSQARWREAAGGTPSAAGSVSPSGPPSGAPSAGLTLSAVGDVIMGNAPGSLPSDGGRTFFGDVAASIRADLAMANLEEPITEDTGTGKCPAPPTAGPGAPASQAPKTCFQFRVPPSYAGVLKNAGFALVNIANNHAYDYGAAGSTNTRAALTSVGIQFTGPPGVIASVTVNGIKVAVLGFAPYAWANSLLDIPSAAALVRRAKAAADLVIVHAHMGAEGADKTHVRPGTETFLGENRGNPIAFTHAVIDAGADLVIGHGPHVMRGMEFYKGKLIAYSLGNFAGYRALETSGVPGITGILRVTLGRDGSYLSGSLVATAMVAPGLPKLDAAKRAIAAVRSLSVADFPTSGARIAEDGKVTPAT